MFIWHIIYAIYKSCSLLGGTPPKTMSKEWQEASNERAKEQKMNPISGKLYLMYFSNPYTEFTVSYRNHFGGVLWKGLCYSRLNSSLIDNILILIHSQMNSILNLCPALRIDLKHWLGKRKHRAASNCSVQTCQFLVANLILGLTQLASSSHSSSVKCFIHIVHFDEV